MSSSHADATTPDNLRRRSSLGSDEGFSSIVPIMNRPPKSPVPDGGTSPRMDPSFMQNQLPLRRNPSLARSHQPSPTRQLSARSNFSYNAGRRNSLTTSLLQQGEEENARDHEEVDECVTPSGSDRLLTNSPSTRSDTSISTLKSNKSVQSLQAIGTYPLGSLRVLTGETLDREASLVPECLSSGDVIIVTGVPAGSFIGCDVIGLNIGKNARFEGVRDLPAGAHFIYGGSSEMGVARNGFWIMSKQRASLGRGEIHVKRWDKYTETIEEEVSQAEIHIQKENVPSIFQSLLPYAISSAPGQQLSGKDAIIKKNQLWQRLTFAIKGAMLTRITNCNWNEWQVTSADDSKPMPYGATDSGGDADMKMAQDNHNHLEYLNSKDRVLSFVFPQNTLTFSNQVIGRQRTEQALDTSVHIISIIANNCTYGDQDELIGELQFCYITGMLLGNVACMEQWSHMTKVIFKAFALALDEPILFRKLIETIHAQLIYNEEGIEGSIFDHDPGLEDDLKKILTVFKSRLTEQLLEKRSSLTDEQSAVGDAFEALESWLWKWGWDLRGDYLRSGKLQLEDGEIVDAELDDFADEDERGEFAPVIVDLEDDGKERGLIRW
ncbi:MAG: hypothetical protein M1818_004673 [Claussenomyces sp. TS43310]|nr:MAG: hypothetical protein M1818_004673 [Claussenomyces sp. TS43310]